MCGITASIALPAGVHGAVDDKPQITSETLRERIQGSLDSIRHRGPDEAGIWISSDAKVGLGHCRLSIHDLSPTGCQPLVSDDGDIHAIVNGEIYDHDRLREECGAKYGYKFKGLSDSEIVVALYKIYGAPGFLEHCRGEFAFVLYDARPAMRKVIAVRDRFGIKPLFWAIVNDRLLLAAEAKAFLAMAWKPEWDVKSIVEGGWMMDDRTLFQGVQKLLPGQWLEIKDDDRMKIRTYWDGTYKDKTVQETRSVDQMVVEVREKMIEAIRLRMRADVPVGVYLSGGIDSSAVAGIVTQLAKEQGVKIGNQEATRVACFSVQFPEQSEYDESSIADRTANWLGLETYKRYVDEDSLAADFADAIYHCEHHNCDMNFVAKFALSTLPQEHGFKVVLTGEGADEHFGGYSFHPTDFLREADLSQPDSPLAQDEKLRTSMLTTLEAETKEMFSYNGYEQPPAGSNADETEGIRMPDNLLLGQPALQIYTEWVRTQYPKHDCRKTAIAAMPTEIREKMQKNWHPLHTAMYIWNKTSLVNVVLSCLGDRTEMAHSIEARTPFLDHVLAEYLNDLSPSVKVHYEPANNAVPLDEKSPMWKKSSDVRQTVTEKWIMREAVRPYITDELYRRRKHPFTAPTRWPKDGPLHRMFKSLLTPAAVSNLGFVDTLVVDNALESAFGDESDPKAFRTLLFVGAWVVLAERFKIPKVEKLSNYC